MSLQSKLFRGDPKLESVAVSDPAHIVPGAMGPHVRKIQQALNLLNGAGITVDGRYGPATAAAVLAYKRKRNIINRSYQTQADDIVGKMTIASLDREMFEKENARVEPVEIKPLNYMRVRPSRSGLPAIFRNPRLLLRNVVGDASFSDDGPPLILPVNPFVTF
jgi:peptidoglycan hydrolase-like protein with peptidoglycan-binding domain